MSKIKGLGYIGCEVTDFNAWDSLLDTVYGLERRGDSGKSVRQYRMDDNHHRLALHKSGKQQVEVHRLGGRIPGRPGQAGR